MPIINLTEEREQFLRLMVDDYITRMLKDGYHSLAREGFIVYKQLNGYFTFEQFEEFAKGN